MKKIYEGEQVWECTQPTERGVYLVNRGDVVSEFSQLELIKVIPNNDGILLDQNGDRLSDYHPSWKFCKLDLEVLNRS